MPAAKPGIVTTQTKKISDLVKLYRVVCTKHSLVGIGHTEELAENLRKHHEECCGKKTKG